MKQAATWEWEIAWLGRGSSLIAGIDEVGRGAWAGPLVACAYMFTSVPSDITLHDSKLLSESQRNTLVVELERLGDYGIGQVSPSEIDKLGLQAGQYLAYERALAGLTTEPHIILLDGRPWKNCRFAHEAIVGGDKKIASIAAASIIAKVHRDTLMQTIVHANHPEYGFNLHVGYGTAKHKDALKQFGVLPIHRKSYKPISKLLQNNTAQPK